MPLVIADEIDHGLRAVRVERLNHFRADTARATGDEHDFAAEIKRIGHIKKGLTGFTG